MTIQDLAKYLYDCKVELDTEDYETVKELNIIISTLETLTKEKHYQRKIDEWTNGKCCADEPTIRWLKKIIQKANKKSGGE